MIHHAKPWWAAWRWRVAVTTVALAVLLMLPRYANPFPIDGDQAVLPAGSELNEDAVYVPHEILRSEYHGDRTSNVVALGDLAFNSPSILGDVARRAGISCGTCHVAGASNAKLFVPGMSTRPGTFDTSGPLFNPKADNHVFDPVRIPSLRGARYLAPYGHDGRMASLRDFVRGVIVGEFAGPEPSPALLDAIVVYVQEIDFLPNPRLGARGRLNNTASDAERRGEALFSKPFPHDPNLSCAGCHQPAGAFVDHQQHDVGSGGIFKTATLLNANFNAPYFHDGRYDSFDQVVDHFDRVYELGLSAQDRADLIAYLRAVGDARQPFDQRRRDDPLQGHRQVLAASRPGDPGARPRRDQSRGRYSGRRVSRTCRAHSRPPRCCGDRRGGRAPHGPRGGEGDGDQPAPHRDGGFGR